MRKKEATVLIIDDDEDILFSARVWLKRFFTTVLTESNPKKISEQLQNHDLDVVLLDMNYNKGYEDGKEGLYWLDFLLDKSPTTSVILMTAFGEVSLAVEAIKKGAKDFILKPWNNEKLYASVNAAVDLSRKEKQVTNLKVIQSSQDQKIDFFGESKPIKQVLSFIDKVAPTDANVLLLGENGTGKYIFAREIHQRSLRKDAPFVHVDLGALSENLFESELFGYAKGAFTDAKKDTPGRFELASEGTLFLDEIGNLTLSLQAKLLSVIQNKIVTRLGESRERKINARIICATNSSIYKMVTQETFRQDLLFRINTMEIVIPPLRERGKDITLLAQHILKKQIRKYDKPNLIFADKALSEMSTYFWPGNVREMENIIERAVILVDNEVIDYYDLRFSPFDNDDLSNTSDLSLDQMEVKYIKKALSKNSGNISTAAKELGITRAALYRRMEKFNL